MGRSHPNPSILGEGVVLELISYIVPWVALANALFGQHNVITVLLAIIVADTWLLTALLESHQNY